MTESTELTALRQKLAQIENELDVNRRLIEATTTLSGVLAGHRSECYKAIAKLMVMAGRTPDIPIKERDLPPRIDWLEK